MKDLAFHKAFSDERWLHQFSQPHPYTSLFFKVGRMYFLNLGAKGLNSSSLFSGCPPSISGKYSGQFRSPNYPENYPDNLECGWGITVPNGYNVEVEFSHFNTEEFNDILRIHDGPSTSSILWMTLHGMWSTPRKVISNGPSLWFNFKTDSSISRRGFKATFTAVNPRAVLGKLSK